MAALQKYRMSNIIVSQFFEQSSISTCSFSVLRDFIPSCFMFRSNQRSGWVRLRVLKDTKLRHFWVCFNLDSLSRYLNLGVLQSWPDAGIVLISQSPSTFKAQKNVFCLFFYNLHSSLSHCNRVEWPFLFSVAHPPSRFLFRPCNQNWWPFTSFAF